MAPALGVLLENRRDGEFILDHWFLVDFRIFSITIEPSRSDSVGMSDSSNLSSEEVSLLSGEGRASVQRSIQISSHQMLDRLRSNDMVRVSVWKLDPVLKDVVGDPIHLLVDSFSSGLDLSGDFCLLVLKEFSLQDPVVV